MSMLKLVAYFLDRYFPTAERLGLRLADVRNAASVLEKFHSERKSVEMELDRIFIGLDPTDMEATMEYDMETRGKRAALQMLDEALGRYKTLKQGCLEKGVFTEDAHEQEMSLRYGLRKYARQLRIDSNEYGLKNILEIAMQRSNGRDGLTAS